MFVYPIGFFSGGASTYEINNSVRFDNTTSSRLQRTPTIAGNRRTYTISLWVRLATLGTVQTLFAASTIAGESTLLINSNNNILFAFGGADSLVTTKTLTDTTGWYHIVLAVDTTQATPSNRIKLYVNGIQITSFSTTNYPTQNDFANFNATFSHDIGIRNIVFGAQSPLNGYISEFNFIDGQQLLATDFGETKNNKWVAKKYTGTFGTNGFYLNFVNNANLGKDASGNNNDYISTNLSTTDQMTDTPTHSYPILNVNDRDLNITLEKVALQVLLPGQVSNIRATKAIPLIGKHYWETKIIVDGTRWATGMATLNTFDVNTGVLGFSTDSLAFSGNPLIQYQGSNAGGTPVNPVAGDVIRIAYDADTRKVWFGVNGTWHNGGNPAAGTGEQFTINPGTYYPVLGNRSTSTSQKMLVNYGQLPFDFSIPSGFNGLVNSDPTPAI